MAVCRVQLDQYVCVVPHLQKYVVDGSCSKAEVMDSTAARVICAARQARAPQRTLELALQHACHSTSRQANNATIAVCLHSAFVGRSWCTKVTKKLCTKECNAVWAWARQHTGLRGPTSGSSR